MTEEKKKKRSKEEILESMKYSKSVGTDNSIIIELLLDIRDLLQSPQSIAETPHKKQNGDTQELHKEIKEQVNKDFAKSEESEA